jgi:putative transcriptional regulator
VSPAHHPSDDILAAYAAGVLPDGPSLVMAAHLECCPQCRAAVGLFEAVGGALLDELPPAGMGEDALALALARIERPASPPPPPPAPGRRRRGPEGVVLPRALARRKIGRPERAGPGVWIAPVSGEGSDGWRTCLTCSPPGFKAPRHGHDDLEYLIVLQGGFADEHAAYRPGDFVESDVGFDHQPTTEGSGPCVCLISTKGGDPMVEFRRLAQAGGV